MANRCPDGRRPWHHLRTGDDAWVRIARAVQDEFAHGRYQAGAAAVSRELSRHLPAIDGNPNELSDDVTLV